MSPQILKHLALKSIIHYIVSELLSPPKDSHTLESLGLWGPMKEKVLRTHGNLENAFLSKGTSVCRHYARPLYIYYLIRIKTP